jgi:hypothetical protein
MDSTSLTQADAADAAPLTRIALPSDDSTSLTQADAADAAPLIRIALPSDETPEPKSTSLNQADAADVTPPARNALPSNETAEPKALDDDTGNLPQWLTSTMFNYLRGVSEDTAWQDLVTELLDFEKKGAPKGVSFLYLYHFSYSRMKLTF